MRRTPLPLMSVLPIAVLALGGCASFSADRVETLTHAPEVRSLSVDLRNGAIKVSRDEAIAGIEVQAEIRAYGKTVSNAKERADAVKVSVARGDDGKVTVRVEFPAPYHGNDSASVSIRAGRLETMSLVTSNGAISADGCPGPITARTANGAIDIKEHAGPTTAETSNGRVALRRVGGPVQANTSNGSIEIVLAEGATGDVQARTSNGRISLELPSSWQGAIEAVTSNGSIELDGSGRGATVRASRNSAAMTIGDSAAARATLRTSNGAVRVNAASPATD
jgi:DUF4097 and DUF4098 domain-containing protein YvlB